MQTIYMLVCDCYTNHHSVPTDIMAMKVCRFQSPAKHMPFNFVETVDFQQFQHNNSID